MTQVLFPRFLADFDEYREAERHWIDLWGQINSEWRQGWCQPWHPLTFVDGTPIMDGNPIFSAASPEQRKSLRVIQLLPHQDTEEFTTWMDTRRSDDDPRIPWRELVLACVLSKKTSTAAFRRIQKWVQL